MRYGTLDGMQSPEAVASAVGRNVRALRQQRRMTIDALAGETLVYDVVMLHLRPEGASVEGKIHALPAGAPIPAEWSEPPLGEAELFFAHLDKARSQQLFGDRNFVFSGELKYMLGLAKVVAEEGKGSQGP